MTGHQCRSVVLWVTLQLFALVTGGCARSARDRPDVQEARGVLPESFSLPPGSEVLVVIDPAECTSCDADLQSLLYTHRIVPQVVALAYSRIPTPQERRDLAIRGLMSDAFVDTALAVVSPRAFVIRRGPDGRNEVRFPREASTTLTRVRQQVSP